VMFFITVFVTLTSFDGVGYVVVQRVLALAFLDRFYNACSVFEGRQALSSGGTDLKYSR